MSLSNLWKWTKKKTKNQFLNKFQNLIRQKIVQVWVLRAAEKKKYFVYEAMMIPVHNVDIFYYDIFTDPILRLDHYMCTTFCYNII